jgi:N-acetylmuramoyl-L-alanine amidase
VLGSGAAFLVLLLSVPLSARQPRSQAWAKSQFSSAEHLEETLQTRPAGERTRADYQEAINAYRRVYLECPTAVKADPSAFAVAQLLEEMGRRFEDDQILRSAIQQYEFLRRQYPGSKSRFAALFHIGEIYKQDLRDRARAQETFQEFLDRYPRNQFAEQARKELAEMATKPESRSGPHSEDAAPSPAGEESENRSGEAKEAHSPENQDSAGAANAGGRKLVRVTGIRSWSNGEGSRVAIDLEDRVRYESQTIENPHRVFFDLFDTRLDPALVGRTFDAPPGLIKKIRVSQFKPYQTRIVLEVGGDLEVETGWRSSPPRLLVELHDRQSEARGAGKEASSGAPAKETQAMAVLPPKVVLAGDAADSPAARDSSEKDDAHDLTSAAKDSGPRPKACDKDPHSSSCPASHDVQAAPSVGATSSAVKKTIVEADDDDSRGPAMATAKPSGVRPSIPSGTAAITQDKVSRKLKGGARDSLDAREAQPMASGDRSLTRVLGLKIGKIVIDPGHGGHDTGSIGPHGFEEKDLVLEVSLRLGKLLASRLGAQVVYTREDDSFIPLETRTAIANREEADLFISVHANSSRDPEARGVETYYLNFTSSPEALEVAARENAVSEESIHELQDLVKKIALKDKIEESREFAVDVNQSLLGGLRSKNPGLRDRGVKKAPFIVLIGANMPSILAEISFLSNPADERRLRSADYQQRIAEALYRGMAKYVNGLSGVKVASRMEKTGAP